MNGERYRRCFAIGTAVGPLDLSFDSKKTQLIVQISISDSTYLRGAIERVRDLFDTRTNPHAHLTDITQSNPVSACYRRELGIRVPGAWDSFETAVCIILGQLVSVEQAREKVKKLVQRFGTKIQNPIFEGCTHLFPTPETLMTADLKEIGLTQVREHALRELSRLVYDKELDLSRSSDLAKTRAQLIGIPGVGPWTVEMIAMRCLGDTNAFPKSDLIIKRALEYHGSQKGDWSPWNAYITIALWKRHATTLSQKNRRPK